MSGTIPSLSQYVLTRFSAADLCSDQANWAEHGEAVDLGYEGVVEEVLSNPREFLPEWKEPLRGLLNRCEPMTGLAYLSTILRKEVESSAPYTPLILKEEESLTEDEQELFDGLNGLLEFDSEATYPLIVSTFSFRLMISLMVGVTKVKVPRWVNGYVIFAAKYGQVKAFRTLRALGADPDKVYNYLLGSTMEVVVRNGQVKMMKEMDKGRNNEGGYLNEPHRKREIENRYYLQAAKRGHIDVLRYFLEKGFKMTCNGEGALGVVRAAVSGNQKETVRFLMGIDAHLNISNDTVSEKMAFDQARHLDRSERRGDLEPARLCYQRLELLKELGVNLNAPNEEGKTAAYRLAENGRVYGLRVLQELGVDLNAPDPSGRTALWRAIEEGNQMAIETLQKFGIYDDGNVLAERIAAEKNLNELVDQATDAYENEITRYSSIRPRPSIRFKPSMLLDEGCIRVRSIFSSVVRSIEINARRKIEMNNMMNNMMNEILFDFYRDLTRRP